MKVQKNCSGDAEEDVEIRYFEEKVVDPVCARRFLAAIYLYREGRCRWSL
jgi:hypothetical protein